MMTAPAARTEMHNSDTHRFGLAYHPISTRKGPRSDKETHRISLDKISFIFAKKWGAGPAPIGQAGAVMIIDMTSINGRLQPC